jgi:hypothetical protein
MATLSDRQTDRIRCCCGFCSGGCCWPVHRARSDLDEQSKQRFCRYRTAGLLRWPPAIACPRPGRRRHPGDLAAVFGDPRGGCRGASDAPGRPRWTARCRGQCAHVGGRVTPRPRQQTRGPGLLRLAAHSGRCRAAAEDVQDVLTSGVSPRPAINRCCAACCCCAARTLSTGKTVTCRSIATCHRGHGRRLRCVRGWRARRELSAERLMVAVVHLAP